MLLSNILVSYGIISAWFIHAIVSMILKRQYNFFLGYYEGLWRILGLIGFFLLGIQVWQITSQILNGFMYEQFAFMSRTLGNFFLWILGLEILLPILFLLNLFKPFKNSRILKTFQVILIFLLIFIGTLLSNDFATSVIPGWHTIIYKPNLLFIFISTGIVILLLNLIFIKFKITGNK